MRDAQQQNQGSEQKGGCQRLPGASNSRNADVVVPSTAGTPAAAVTPAKVGAPATHAFSAKFTGENIVFNLGKNSFRKGHKKRLKLLYFFPKIS
jgi:hypothetical protein